MSRRSRACRLLVKIAQQFDGKDRAYLEAFGLGSEGKEKEVYAAAGASDGRRIAEKWSDAFAWIAWRLHPAEAVPISRRAPCLPTSAPTSAS